MALDNLQKFKRYCATGNGRFVVSSLFPFSKQSGYTQPCWQTGPGLNAYNSSFHIYNIACPIIKSFQIIGGFQSQCQMFASMW